MISGSPRLEAGLKKFETFEYVYFILFILYFLSQYFELMRVETATRVVLLAFYFFFCLSHVTENKTKVVFSSFKIHK